MIELMLLLALCLQVESGSEDQPLVPAPVPMQERPDAHGDFVDLDKPCPATSLYVLLRLSRREADFDAIVRRLGEGMRTGVSASELCDAAKDFGLPLKVVQLRKRDLDKLHEPWIAFQNPCAGVGKGIGHYVVARVVDSSSVQFIDPPRKPVLWNQSDLFNDQNGWARIALVPQSSLRITPWILLVTTGALGLILSGTWLRKSLRQR